MRLLNTSSLQLEDFVANIPPYAILSHTWGAEEYLFEDWKQGIGRSKSGYQKVKEFCEVARANGLDFAWVDTCCIDKSSSAELSEAINSMFTWYSQSDVCYAYIDLEDQRVDSLAVNDANFGSPGLDAGVHDQSIRNIIETEELETCRWIKRGWTLQELIAPRHVIFYTRSWKICGSRQSLASELHRITGIDVQLLGRGTWETPRLSEYSTARRMSWAAGRQTTRPEDTAYCLLGLFNVHMPLIYGEGQAKAFFRLQEEIMRHSMDHSILAWGVSRGEFQMHSPVIAQSPDNFRSSSNVEQFPSDDEPFEMTNKGLRVTLPIIAERSGEQKYLAVLSCRRADSFHGPLAIRLKAQKGSSRLLESRTGFDSHVVIVDGERARKAIPRTVYLSTTPDSTPEPQTQAYFRFETKCNQRWLAALIGDTEFSWLSDATWYADQRVLSVDKKDKGGAVYEGRMRFSGNNPSFEHTHSQPIIIRRLGATYDVGLSYTPSNESHSGTDALVDGNLIHISIEVPEVPTNLAGRFIYQVTVRFWSSQMSDACCKLHSPKTKRISLLSAREKPACKCFDLPYVDLRASYGPYMN